MCEGGGGLRLSFAEESRLAEAKSGRNWEVLLPSPPLSPRSPNWAGAAESGSRCFDTIERERDGGRERESDSACHASEEQPAPFRRRLLLLLRCIGNNRLVVAWRKNC